MTKGSEFASGAASARAMWVACLSEATKAGEMGDLARYEYLLSEADRHSERAADYERRYAIAQVPLNYPRLADAPDPMQ